MADSAPAIAAVQAGDMVFGKYCVERALGTGGMGSVYAAIHVQLEQRVALKILDMEVAKEPEIRERFLREARIAAKLQSEHAARVLDIGVLDNGLHCIVMEYLEGEDLATVLQANGPLEVPVALSYLLSASEALAEAHAHGVVHRDVKPANLFLSRRPDGSRLIKIIDFGIAGFDMQIASDAASDRPLTRTRALVGTPSYMSPEQLASAREVDARSDIWALGVTLFELLTGTRPFAKGSLPEICASILKDEPRLLTDERADLPKDLAKVVARCLEKERDRRYKDLSEFAAALLPFAPFEAEKSLERIRAVLTRLNREVAPESQRLIQAHQPTQAAQHRNSAELRSEQRAIKPTEAAASERAAAQEKPTAPQHRRPMPSTPDEHSPWDLDLKKPPPAHLQEGSPNKSKRPTLRREEDPSSPGFPGSGFPSQSPSPPPAVASSPPMSATDRRKRPSIRREEPTSEPPQALKKANNSFRLEAIPKLSAKNLTQLQLDPRDGFLLSRIDGIATVQEILDISGMNATDALDVLRRLHEKGVISLE